MATERFMIAESWCQWHGHREYIVYSCMVDTLMPLVVRIGAGKEQG